MMLLERIGKLGKHRGSKKRIKDESESEDADGFERGSRASSASKRIKIESPKASDEDSSEAK